MCAKFSGRPPEMSEKNANEKNVWTCLSLLEDTDWNKGDMNSGSSKALDSHKHTPKETDRRSVSKQTERQRERLTAEC